MGNAGYAQENDTHVLADVLRPQLHQLRGVPDGPQRAAQRAAVVRAAATRRTGAPRCPQITDDVPRIGAVAWWKANNGPAGSAGHVAYVEQVVSADEIIISQDSWGGDFSWAVVTRSSGNWPSGFVHFNDQAADQHRPPVIAGIAKVGAVADRDRRQLEARRRATIAYQWFADGEPLAQGHRRRPSSSRPRLGQELTVRTTASQLGYPTRTAVSTPTEAVLPGELRNTGAPHLRRRAGRLDAHLDTGAWDPEPTPRHPVVRRRRADRRRHGRHPRPRPRPGLPRHHGDRHRDRVPTTTRSPPRRGSEQVAPGTFTIDRAPSISGTPPSVRCSPSTRVPSARGRERPGRQWLRDGEPVLTRPVRRTRSPSSTSAPGSRRGSPCPGPATPTTL